MVVAPPLQFQTAKRMIQKTHSKYFESELKNFNKSYEIKNGVDEDMTLVQVHSDAAVGFRKKFKFRTKAEETIKFSTCEERSYLCHCYRRYEGVSR